MTSHLFGRRYSFVVVSDLLGKRCFLALSFDGFRFVLASFLCRGDRL